MRFPERSGPGVKKQGSSCNVDIAAVTLSTAPSAMLSRVRGCVGQVRSCMSTTWAKASWRKCTGFWSPYEFVSRERAAHHRLNIEDLRASSVTPVQTPASGWLRRAMVDRGIQRAPVRTFARMSSQTSVWMSIRTSSRTSVRTSAQTSVRTSACPRGHCHQDCRRDNRPAARLASKPAGRRDAPVGWVLSLVV